MREAGRTRNDRQGAENVARDCGHAGWVEQADASDAEIAGTFAMLLSLASVVAAGLLIGACCVCAGEERRQLARPERRRERQQHQDDERAGGDSRQHRGQDVRDAEQAARQTESRRACAVCNRAPHENARKTADVRPPRQQDINVASRPARPTELSDLVSALAHAPGARRRRAKETLKLLLRSIILVRSTRRSDICVQVRSPVGCFPRDQRLALLLLQTGALTTPCCES